MAGWAEIRAKGRLRMLFAFRSIVALVVGGGATAAQAASCDAAGPGYSNSGAASCITIANTSFGGAVSNSGTLSPGGIVVTNATIDGGIVNSGTIAAQGDGIVVNGAAVSGGITNSGSIGPGGIAVTNSTITGAIDDSGSNAGGISIDGGSTVGGGLHKGQR